MNEPKDKTIAFPTNPDNEAYGMDLRDYFAGQVLAASAEVNVNAIPEPGENHYTGLESHAAKIARWSYLVADAMMAERTKD